MDWSPDRRPWQVYAVSQRPSGQKVKRAAPGGAGHMLNLLYPDGDAALSGLGSTEAFATTTAPNPARCITTPTNIAPTGRRTSSLQFEKRRGYRLQTELPALFGDATRNTQPATRSAEPDHVARVKSDYRETISDIMAEESLPLWAQWSHGRGFLTRNEAHGSPGNLLDLYAVADIPETEMFHTGPQQAGLEIRLLGGACDRQATSWPPRPARG